MSINASPNYTANVQELYIAGKSFGSTTICVIKKAVFNTDVITVVALVVLGALSLLVKSGILPLKSYVIVPLAACALVAVIGLALSIYARVKLLPIINAYENSNWKYVVDKTTYLLGDEGKDPHILIKMLNFSLMEIIGGGGSDDGRAAPQFFGAAYTYRAIELISEDRVKTDGEKKALRSIFAVLEAGLSQTRGFAACYPHNILAHLMIDSYKKDDFQEFQKLLTVSPEIFQKFTNYWTSCEVNNLSALENLYKNPYFYVDNEGKKIEI